MADQPSPSLIAEVEKVQRRFAQRLGDDMRAIMGGDSTVHRTYPTAICVAEDDDGTVWEFRWPDGKPQYRRL